MRRLALALLLAATAAELPGCAGGRPAPEPFRRQSAASRAAERAHRRGDLAGAIAAREQALLAARSVEDVEGIAVAVLDLAALHREAGEPARADAALAELLADPPPLPFSAARRADAAFLAGLLAVDDDDLVRGRAFAERARGLCSAGRCPRAGAILNLLARIDYLGGDFDCAARRGGEAARLLAGDGDSAELANARRIVADADLARDRPGEAGRGYEKALAMDRRLGLGDKVFLDLVGLGRAAAARGRAEEAAGWFRRARAVALAGGDAAGVREAEALLASPPSPGR